IEPRLFAIITTAADSFMQPIHARMPVILNSNDEKAWLSGEPLREYAGTSSRLPHPHYKLRRDLERAWIERDGELSDFLRLLETPYSPALRAYEVSRSVNRASVDIPDLLQPVDHAADNAPLFKSIGK